MQKIALKTTAQAAPIVNVSTAGAYKEVITALLEMSADSLQTLINNAVKEFKLDPSWQAPRIKDKNKLIEFISDFCESNGVVPQLSSMGTLSIKRMATGQTAKIEIKSPITTFSKPDVIEEFIDLLDGCVRYTKAGGVPGYLYAPFMELRKSLGDAFTLKQVYKLQIVSINDFKESYYQKDPVVYVSANTAGSGYLIADPKSLVKEINLIFPQDKKGNIFAVARLDNVAGLDFNEMVTFIKRFYAEVLETSAKKAGLLEKLEASVNTFLHTSFPDDHVFYVTDRAYRIPLTGLNPSLALIDFNGNPSGDFYTNKQIDKAIERMEGGYADPKAPAKQDEPVKPKGFDLNTLKGKHIVMIGLPPKGYSTAKFQSELKHLNVTIEAKFDFSTKVAFFNPAQVAGPKIEKAKAQGIQMVPYDDIVKALIEG